MKKPARAARQLGGGLLVGAIISLVAATATAADTVRIALIDPFNDDAAPFQFMIDEINTARRGPRRQEARARHLHSPDSMSSRASGPCSRRSTQGIPFVAEGPGSHIALALSKAVAEHNQADPDTASST